MDFFNTEIWAFCQVVFIDLILAGDNAIVVGMVAAGVAPEKRKKVIFSGIAIAVILRIVFAAAAVQLLDIIGLTLAGGLLLLWVCWKLYRELRERADEEIGMAVLEDGNDIKPISGKPIHRAVWRVAAADLSMSLDNVLGVAGAAEDHPRALIFGLLLSVTLMGFGAAIIARFLQRYPWLAYFGLLLIAYVAFSMIWRGCLEVVEVVYF